MTHYQVPVNNWPQALLLMPDDNLEKSVGDAGFLSEVYRQWLAGRRDPARLWTCYRHMDLYFPRGDQATLRRLWEEMFFRFVNRTYLEQHAAHVKLVEELNEYFTTESINGPELPGYIASVEAAIWVWNTKFRGRVVHSPDGGEGLIPADCRLVIGNVTVANDIPRRYFELAVSEDCVLGYHPYIYCPNGERAADDWANHSGRWNRLEQEFGVDPVWAFTECGPYVSKDGGWINCLNGDVIKLVGVMGDWWSDTSQTAGYREGRVLGPGAWFTVGGDRTGWPNYDLQLDQLIKLADRARSMWNPGLYTGANMDKQKIMDYADGIVNQANRIKVEVMAWWESWPEGLISPSRALLKPNRVMTFYHADGTIYSPQPLLVPVTWTMWVNERRGRLLRVYDQLGTVNDWYVNAADVQPAAP